PGPAPLWRQRSFQYSPKPQRLNGSSSSLRSSFLNTNTIYVSNRCSNYSNNIISLTTVPIICHVKLHCYLKTDKIISSLCTMTIQILGRFVIQSKSRLTNNVV